MTTPAGFAENYGAISYAATKVCPDVTVSNGSLQIYVKYDTS